MPRSSIRFWILAGLLATNLVVGVLSLYFLRSVNQRYAALFEGGAPAIYSLRTLTREVTGVQRLARRIVTPAHEPAWRDLLPEMTQARNQVDARIQEVRTFTIFQGTEHPAAVLAASEDYAGHVRTFLALAAEGRLDDAAEYNLIELRPSHDRFQHVIDRSADFVAVNARDLRDRYARDTRFFGGLSLAFASVPIVAVTIGVLIMTVLIGVLLLVVINPRPDRR